MKEESKAPNLSVVLGYIAVQNVEELKEKIKILDRLGYGNKEIGLIVGISDNAVAIQKVRIKKNK